LFISPRSGRSTPLARRTFLGASGAALAAATLAGIRLAFGEGEDLLGDPGLGPETAPAKPAPAYPPAGFAYGMQAHMYYHDVAPAIALVQDAGFGWAKQQVRWSDVEKVQGQVDWSPLDRIVDQAAAAGVRLLFSVVTAPSWSRTAGGTDGPPDDPATLADFVARLAARYAGRVHTYEIWNEQNLSREWGGSRINAGQYVELLKAAYPAIKAADAQATVISGALTPTGFNDPLVAIDDVVYLQQMYGYQDGVFKDVCDGVGAHAGGFNNPPDDTPARKNVRSTNFKGNMSFYFRRLEQLREIMVLGGDSAKKIWVTEFGWSTANRARGYEYGNDNTEADQAAYLVRAFEIAREWGWVDGMFVWNLNFQQVVPASDEKFPFGIVRPDGSPRPAFTALKLMPKVG
jgi:hypothetical protein